MNKQGIYVYLFCGLILIISIVLNGCLYQDSPELDLLIENQTDEILTISVKNESIGILHPHETTLIITSFDYNVWEIEAKSTQGTIVFSKEFSMNTLQKIDDKTYKAVISPLDLVPGISDNTTQQ